MGVGLEVYGTTGALQFSSDTVQFGRSIEGEITLVPDGQAHPQPIVEASLTVTGTNPILAILPTTSGNVCVDRTLVNSATSFTFVLRAQSSANVVVKYLVFDSAQSAYRDPSISNAGLQLFDEAAILTFDAAMPVLRIVDIINMAMPGNLNPTGVENDVYETMQTINVPSGKKYAVVQAASAYLFTGYKTGEYSPSATGEQLEVPEPGGGPGPNDTYEKTRYESYRATVSETSDVITIGLTRFEIFDNWFTIGAEPNRFNTWGSLSFLIVDITGYTTFVLPGNRLGGINWLDASPSTTANSLDYSTAYRTMSNINQNVTLEVSVQLLDSNLSSATVQAMSATRGELGNANSSATFSFVVTPGEQLAFRVVAGTTSGRRTGILRTTIVNLSDSNRLVDSFDLSFTVDSDNNYNVQDITPNLPITFPTVTVNTTATVGNTNQSVAQITGISSTIDVAVYSVNYIGENMEGGGLFVKKGPSSSGPWTDIGQTNLNGTGAQFLNFTIANNEWIAYQASAGSYTRSKHSEFNLNLYNRSQSTTLDINNLIAQTRVILTVGPDLVNDPVYWPSTSNSSTSNTVGQGNSYQTISGISAPITLRHTITEVSGNLDGGSLDIYKNGSYIGSCGISPYSSYYDMQVSNGDQVSCVGNGFTNSGVKSGTITVHATNISTGAFIDDFSFTLTADSDNNYNVAPDLTPDPISFPLITINTSSLSGYTNGVIQQITGISQAITGRADVQGRGGSMDTAIFLIYMYNPTTGAFTEVARFNPSYEDSSPTWTMQPNHSLHYLAYCASNGGRQDLNFNIRTFNVSTGSDITTTPVNLTVGA